MERKVVRSSLLGLILPDELETTAGINLRLGGPGTPPSERILGDGKSNSQEPYQGDTRLRRNPFAFEEPARLRLAHGKTAKYLLASASVALPSYFSVIAVLLCCMS